MKMVALGLSTAVANSVPLRRNGLRGARRNGATLILALLGAGLAGIAPGQAFREFPITNSFPSSITTGPDGNLWFTESTGNKVGRISTAGVVTGGVLLKSKHGSGFVPTSCSGIFADVACASPYAAWIEPLSAEGITGGCGSGHYCPGAPTTHGQVAAFLAKTFDLRLSAQTPPGPPLLGR